MKFETNIFIFPVEGKMAYPQAEIPADIAEQFLEAGESKKRVIITFPNGSSFHRAIQRSKNGYYYIGLGKNTLREAKAEVGTEITVSLTLDTSEFGMAFPEEFQEVLLQDEAGNKQFLALNPGRKRSLLYYIDSAKTLETRIKRSLNIVHKLKTDTLYGGAKH